MAIRVLLLCMLIVFLAVIPCYAQNEPQIYPIAFDGGLVSKYNSLLIKDNQSPDLCNFDFTNGALLKRSGIKNLINVNAYFNRPVNNIGRFYGKDKRVKYVLTDGQGIRWTNDFTDTFVLIETDNYLLGEKINFSALNNLLFFAGSAGNNFKKYDGYEAALVGSPSKPICFQGSDTGNTGTYAYRVSYINASGEIAWGPLSDSIAVTNGSVDLVFTHIPGSDIIAQNVYRQYLGNIYYLNQISPDSTVYSDTTDTYAPVSGFTYEVSKDIIIPRPKYVETYYNQLVIAGMSEDPSMIWFSESFNPDAWDAFNTIQINPDDGDKITGLRQYQGYLVIFKENYMYKFVGTDPSPGFQVVKISEEVGCIDIATCKEYNGILIFMARDGFYSYDGSSLNRISEPIQPVFATLAPPKSFKKSWMVGSWEEWKRGTLAGDSISWDSEPGKIVYTNWFKSIITATGKDTYTSEIKYIGNVNQWGNFICEFEIDRSTRSPTFQFRTGATLSEISNTTWYDITQGDTLKYDPAGPTPEQSTPTNHKYFQFRILNPIIADTGLIGKYPRIENVEISWSEGESYSYATAEIYDNKYWVACQTDTGVKYDIILTYDFNGRWNVYKKDNITKNHALFNYNNRLYAGQDTGVPALGWIDTYDTTAYNRCNDIGNTVNAYYTTKKMDMGSINDYKYFEAVRYTLNLDYNANDTTYIYIDYKIDNDTQWTTVNDTIPLSFNGSGIFNKRLDLNRPNLYGATIQYRIRDPNRFRFELIRLDTIYTVIDDFKASRWYR